MRELRMVHSADLDDRTRLAIRQLMAGAFGKISEDTYQNVLGGVHALLAEDGELIGHASVVQRRMLHGGGRCAPGISRASRCARTGAAAGAARR